ncbi:L,D-transpeptidase family protein [Thermodesulfobacteriota bacterium]
MKKRNVRHLLLGLLAFLLAIQLVWPPVAHVAKRPIVKSKIVKTIPSPMLKWPDRGSEYAILVDKSAQKTYVIHKANPSKPLRTFTCSTGENGGIKTKRNDRKTPEGIYFVINSYVDKDLSPIYGTRAFPLDYPNPIDKKAGRGGYGIWFHGLDKPLKPRDTNGCIALKNKDINALAKYITLNETPVIIRARVPMADQKNLKKEAKEINRRLEEWRRAWEEKDIGQYMALYHPTFSTGRKNWNQWREYKTRLAKKYKHIDVKIDNLSLIKTDGVVVASFVQTYRTDTFESRGLKRLYLQQNSKEWKITRETFQGRDHTRVLAAAPKPPQPEAVEVFLDRWKRAWEKKDLNSYMACYDKTFKSRGMNRWAWKKHRKRLNQKFQTVKVDFQDLKVREVSKRTAQVTFRQEYQADQYQDIGLKNITLIRRGQQWKIKKEEWQPLK